MTECPGCEVCELAIELIEERERGRALAAKAEIAVVVGKAALSDRTDAGSVHLRQKLDRLEIALAAYNDAEGGRDTSGGSNVVAPEPQSPRMERWASASPGLPSSLSADQERA